MASKDLWTRPATIDFESRSACNLKQHGSWRYSLDPTTEVLCMAFRLPYWPKGQTDLWHPAFPHLGLQETLDVDLYALMDWIQRDGLVEAYNAWFERGVWTNIMVPQFAWMPIPPSSWRCSAAKAAAHSLPRALAEAISVLALPQQKDAEGYALMRKVTSPRKPLKKERQAWLNAHHAGECLACKGRGVTRGVTCAACQGKKRLPVPELQVPPMPRLWHESLELFEQLWAYCRQDVIAEEALSLSLPNLSDAETEIYLLDQTINARGFYLDQEAVTQAIRLIEEETVEINQQLTVVTEGAVTKGAQRARMQQWCVEQGLTLEDTQASTIDKVLKASDLSPIVHQGLTLMCELGRSSTAKYQTMQRWLCPDGRVRGGLLYHGAGTGRWSGTGVQPQNFVRGGTLKLSQQQIWDDLQTGDRDLMRAAYGSVMLLLSEGLRGAICATPGYQLYVADYASIEARVLFWVAGQEDGLEIFRRGEDLYCKMAEAIYHHPVTKRKVEERLLGKVAILGCGYQMGPPKFVLTAANYGVTITEEFSAEVVHAYRTRFAKVPQLWADQETAAIEAIEQKLSVSCGHIQWAYQAPFLYCQLPSGRSLAYPFPEMHTRKMPWGEQKWGLTYMGINSYTRQWQRQYAYGGMLVENIVQAVARDIMAEAMLRMEQSEIYAPVLSVHDELIAESRIGQGSVHDFEQMMAECPAWMTGCPIVAEGWVGDRYHK